MVTCLAQVAMSQDSGTKAQLDRIETQMQMMLSKLESDVCVRKEEGEVHCYSRSYLDRHLCG